MKKIDLYKSECTVVYKVIEYNKWRESRGEKYCYRAKIIYEGDDGVMVWLSKKDIENIKKDKYSSLEIDTTVEKGLNDEQDRFI